MNSFKTIETTELAAVSGGTYRSGAAQVVAGRQEMIRARDAASAHADEVGSATAKATRAHDSGVGMNTGAAIGGFIGKGIGWGVGAVRGLGTGLAANLRTFYSDISQ